jgi:hypothetical protein
MLKSGSAPSSANRSAMRPRSTRSVAETRARDCFNAIVSETRDSESCRKKKLEG